MKKNIKRLVALFLVVLLIWILYNLFSSYPKNKITVLTPNENGLEIIRLDPQDWTIYKIKIPGNTEINVADNKGKWKAESLWKLSIQESKKGLLAKESIVKSLSIPVEGWDEESLNKAINGNLLNIIQTFPTKENSTLSKKEINSIIWFKIMRFKLSESNLGDLTEEKIKKIFSTDSVGEAEIINSGATHADEIEVSNIINILGGKVILTKTDDSYKNINQCQIEGPDSKVNNLLKNVLDCDKTKFSEKLKIILGQGIL